MPSSGSLESSPSLLNKEPPPCGGSLGPVCAISFSTLQWYGASLSGMVPVSRQLHLRAQRRCIACARDAWFDGLAKLSASQGRCRAGFVGAGLIPKGAIGVRVRIFSVSLT